MSRIIKENNAPALMEKLYATLSESGHRVENLEKSFYHNIKFKVDGILVHFRPGTTTHEGDRIYIGSRFSDKKIYVIPKWGRKELEVSLDVDKVEKALARKKELLGASYRERMERKKRTEEENILAKKKEAILTPLEEKHKDLIQKLRDKDIYRGMSVTSVEDETVSIRLNLVINFSVPSINTILKVLED